MTTLVFTKALAERTSNRTTDHVTYSAQKEKNTTASSANLRLST
jgi:hypothetical protein